MAKAKQGAGPGPKKGRCAPDLPIGSHRQLDLDAGRCVRELQLLEELRHLNPETTATAARAVLPSLNGGGGLPPPAMDPSAHLSPPPESAKPNPATGLTDFLFLPLLSPALVPPPLEKNSFAKGLFSHRCPIAAFRKRKETGL